MALPIGVVPTEVHKSLCGSQKEAEGENISSTSINFYTLLLLKVLFLQFYFQVNASLGVNLHQSNG